MTDETKNMYSNDSSIGKEDRLKPYVVVSREWYRDIMSLHACLKLMADNMYFDGKNIVQVTPLILKSELLERNLYDYKYFYSPLTEKDN